MSIYPLILISISLEIFNSVIKTHISKYRKINSTYMFISSLMRLPISFFNTKEYIIINSIIALIAIIVALFELIELNLLRDYKFLRISIGTNSRIIFVAIGQQIFKKQRIDFYQKISIFLIIISTLANAFGTSTLKNDIKFFVLSILIGFMSASSSLLYDIKVRHLYDKWSYKFSYDIFRSIFLFCYFCIELYIKDEKLNLDWIVLEAAIISTIKSVVQYLIICQISALTRVIIGISLGIFTKQITSFILNEKLGFLDILAFYLSFAGFLFYNHKDVVYFYNNSRRWIRGHH
ncbi:hypothetical protein DMUE_2187 [Dictyocoela muelleri]|nr:hypothetical protein DMUE_2187 [Dictyocoela muelleri]